MSDLGDRDRARSGDAICLVCPVFGRLIHHRSTFSPEITHAIPVVEPPLLAGLMTMSRFALRLDARCVPARVIAVNLSDVASLADVEDPLAPGT
jgi:hypothetical protein